MNPVARNLLAYYRPGTSLASRPSNVFGNPRRTLDDRQGGGRVDVALGPRAQLFGQFFRQSTPSVQPGLFPLSGLSYENESTLAMLQHTWSLSATMVNSLRFGFLRNAAVGSNQGQSLGPILDQIGVTNTFSRNGVTADKPSGVLVLWTIQRRSRKPGQHLATGRGVHAQPGWTRPDVRRRAALPARMASERKRGCAGEPVLPTGVHGAVGRQLTGPARARRGDRRLLRRFPARIPRKRHADRPAGRAVSGDAGDSVLSGHLEGHSRSDSELRGVLVFRDAAGASGLGAGPGARLRSQYGTRRLLRPRADRFRNHGARQEQRCAPIRLGLAAGLQQNHRDPRRRRPLLLRVPVALRALSAHYRRRPSRRVRLSPTASPPLCRHTCWASMSSRPLRRLN